MPICCLSTTFSPYLAHIIFELRNAGDDRSGLIAACSICYTDARVCSPNSNIQGI
jgi:hypothetical protein